MLYGALVQTSQRSSEGFDRLSPNGSLWLSTNGSLFARGLHFPLFVRCLHTPFGLSLSKALRGIRLP